MVIESLDPSHFNKFVEVGQIRFEHDERMHPIMKECQTTEKKVAEIKIICGELTILLTIYGDQQVSISCS